MVDFNLSLNLESVNSAYPAPPLAVEPETPVRDVFALLKAQDRGSVLICQENVVVGIFTERDALGMMARDADLSVPIRTVMVPNPVSLRSDDTVGEAIRKMSAGGYRRMPILDDSNQPIGMAAVTGIVHYLVEHFPEAVYNLPPDPDPITHEREGA